MKVNFLLIIFILVFSFLRAQTYSSSCIGTANMETIYRNDAAYQAMLRTYTFGSTYKDSIELDPALKDSILRAFYAIYNVQGQLWRDTIVQLFGNANFLYFNKDSLHGIANKYIDENYYNQQSSRQIMIRAYNDVPWVTAWLNGNYNSTAYDSIDNLVNHFALTVAKNSYQLYSDRTLFVVMINQTLNLPALVKYFKSLVGVQDAYGMRIFTLGDGIDLEFIDGNIIITYSKGCGDCPSGCTFGRDWKFKVNLSTDCSVEYLSVKNWGAPLPNRDININACIGMVIPVQLNEVKAIFKDNYRIIQWRVETETDVLQYFIERSVDGSNYETIGEKIPKNTGLATQYIYTDAQLIDGDFYYRIKMISSSGEIKYSTVARLTVKSDAFIRVFPTIISNKVLTIQFNKMPKGVYKAVLCNMSGQEIFSTQIIVTADRQLQTLHLPALNQNCYRLSVSNNVTELVKKIFITH